MKCENSTQNFSLDIIIPCFNARETLARAVESCLAQTACQKIILVDDGSTDSTQDIIQDFSQQYPNKVIALLLAENMGVATARNFAAIHSQADLIAFLDADDAYEPHALDPAPTIFSYLPELSLLRLKLTPIDLDKKYSTHPRFDEVWQTVQMTVGGNTIFQRHLFLACGGFATDHLFRELGGEDGVLGLALAQSTAVGTLFESHHAGVRHYCRDSMHAQRLLDANLFNQHDSRITSDAITFADKKTTQISNQLDHVTKIINHLPKGRTPVKITYSDD